MSVFFERLCQLCKENDTSPNAVAKKLSISSGSVTAWKKNGTNPRTDTAQKIADYFHVSLDYLLGNVNDPFFMLDNKKILDDINENPATENNQSEVNESPTEKKLKLLARHLDKVPDEQRERLIKNFEDSIDLYLDALNISKGDE